MATPLKVGMVGTGGISNAHITAYMEHPDRVQLKAVCDIDESRAQEYAKKAGVEAVYTDFDKMLREADIEAVDNCTFHPQHAPLCIAAAEAGKHVIVEKPMALSMQECRDMIAAADKAGVTLMVAQHLRHSPEARTVKSIIDEGKLGDILAVRTHIIGRGAGAGLERYSDANLGGGVLQVNSVHHIDLLRYYVGNVKRVTGVCKSVGPRQINGAEDLVIANLAFENGVLGDLFSSPGESNGGMSYTVFGSNGTIQSTPPGMPSDDVPTRHFGTIMLGLKQEEEEIDRRDPRYVQRRYNAPFEAIDPSGIDLPSTNYFVNEILHFEECVRTGREPTSSGRDNIETVKVILGIFESSRTGKAVNLDDL